MLYSKIADALQAASSLKWNEFDLLLNNDVLKLKEHGHGILSYFDLKKFPLNWRKSENNA